MNKLSARGSRARRTNYSIVSLVCALLVLTVGALAVPLYSVDSNSAAPKQTSPDGRRTSPSSTRAVHWASAAPSALMPVQEPPAETVEVFESDCLTLRANNVFNVSDEICVKVTNAPVFALFPLRRITIVNVRGHILAEANVLTPTQTFNYTIPTTVTAADGLDVRGGWSANMIATSDASVHANQPFTVRDPANAAANIQVHHSVAGGESTVGAGGTIHYRVLVSNRGPDTATNVLVTEGSPTTTQGSAPTFVSNAQLSGPVCTFAGDLQCTIASLPAGASAELAFDFSVAPGTPNYATIANTASATSAITDAQPADNTSTTYVTVTGVSSTTDCELGCPEDINANADTTVNGDRGTYVTYAAPTSSGDCGAITSTPASGSFFPVGTTVVTATSATGDGSCSFTVTVADSGSNPPTISCPANKEVDAMGDCSAVVDVGTATATGGENVTMFATRSDGKPMYNCDANGQNCVRQSPDYPFSGGTTTITWTATSHNAAGEETGNSSCTQTITVNNANEDTTAPVITCPANITRNNDSGACSAVINVGTATATDNCDSNPTVEGTRSDGQSLSDPYPKGTTTITWTATDSSGNEATCTQTITVIDNEDPAISCPANVVTTTDAGSCSATVDPGTATATDNCDTSPTIVGTRSDSQPLNAPYPKGTTTITWRATDDDGNYSECEQTVTVNDEEPPTISCPANITVYLAPNSTDTTAVVNYTAPVGQDNCGGSTTTLEAGLASGSAFPLGTTTVTFRVTDASGNYTECSFDVTVLYNFTGFFSPVNNPPVFNNVTAGRAIPIKFSLSGNKGLGIFAAGYPLSQQIACDGTLLADVEGTETSGGSTLTYSPDQYHYSWKTESAWAGTCRILIVKLNDGTEHTALFKFK